MIKNLKDNMKNTFAVLLLPVLLYFFVGPLSVYCPNSQDFKFTYDVFFYSIAAIGIAVLLAGTFVIAIMPKALNRCINMLIFFAGIMSYIQDMFLNFKLSENDGSAIKWDEIRGKMAVNLIIWVAVLIVIVVLYFVLKDKFTKATYYISVFVSLLQIVTVVTLLVQAIGIGGSKGNSANYDLVGDDQYQLAKDENIIVFIVDSYGSRQLEEGLKNNPDLTAGLKDFTYYNNADCSYFGTFPSVTHMLTGVDLDYDVSIPEYLDKAWTDANARAFYDTIHANGYGCYLYSTGGRAVYGDMSKLYGCFDNDKEVDIALDNRAVFFRMLKISIFKFVPYVVKPYFEVPTYLFYYVTHLVDNDDVNSGNAIYYEGLMDRKLDISDEMSKALIIQHIDGTHPPTELSPVAEPDSEATLQDTQEGIMYILDCYMNQLKDLGLYDNSTIIITADHGRWDVYGEGEDPQVIYFIKCKNEVHDEVLVNGAPISHDDFRATILSLIGEDYSDYGKAIFDYGENDERTRTLVNREVNEAYPDTPGESCNVYAVYTYTGDRDTIVEKATTEGPDEEHRIIGW